MAAAVKMPSLKTTYSATLSTNNTMVVLNPNVGNEAPPQPKSRGQPKTRPSNATRSNLIGLGEHTANQIFMRGPKAHQDEQASKIERNYSYIEAMKEDLPFARAKPLTQKLRSETLPMNVSLNGVSPLKKSHVRTEPKKKLPLSLFGKHSSTNASESPSTCSSSSNASSGSLTIQHNTVNKHLLI